MPLASNRRPLALCTLLTSLAASPALAQSSTSPAPAPTAPSTTPADDGTDPNVARDVSQYNLGKNGLAIEGYDPVAYFPEGGGQPKKGDPKLEYRYRGVLYRFATQENLDRFKAAPRKYEPCHGGWCSTAVAYGDKVEISPKAYKVTDGRLFLFYNGLLGNARNSWVKDEPKSTAEADTNWKKISGEEPRTPAKAPPPDAR